MKIGLIVTLLMVGVCYAGSSFANPDGPVGWIVIAPTYVRDIGKEGWVTDATTWRAGMTVGVPVSRYLTLELEGARVRYPSLHGWSFNGPTDEAQFENGRILTDSRMRTNFGASLRIYLPLSKAARAERSK